MKAYVLIIAAFYLSVLMDEARSVVVVSSPVRPGRSVYYGNAQEAERMLMHSGGGQHIRGARSPTPFRGNFQQRPVYSSVAHEKRFGRSPEDFVRDPLATNPFARFLGTALTAVEPTSVAQPGIVPTAVDPTIFPTPDLITAPDAVAVPAELPSTDTLTATGRRKRADGATFESHDGRRLQQ